MWRRFRHETMFPDPERSAQEEIVAVYAAASEAALMTIARGYDSLEEEAQAALRAEFARRGLEPPLVEEVEGEGEYVQRKLVTIRRYRDLSEAIVARSVIESAGIYCFLQNENIVRLDWQISNFIGGIRLQVPEAEVAVAEELLSQPMSASIELLDDETYIQPRCMRCDSLDLTYEGASRGAALASLYLFALPAPLGEKTWRCNHCGLRWVDRDEDAADLP